jgi:predicted DNA-binding transcriptional regulator AlpA
MASNTTAPAVTLAKQGNACAELAPETLLVAARQAARMCGKSLRTWRSWDAAGLIPRPIRIGHSVLWRAEELRLWVLARCPRRQEWEPQNRKDSVEKT